MKRNRINTWFSLQFNPFSPDLPCENLWIHPKVELFTKRIVTLTDTGGFALISGEPGSGKSAVLRILRAKLGEIPDMQTRVLSRPQSSVQDLYRELGEIYSIPVSPFNRWGGFNQLRKQWKDHLSTTLLHPVLLVDEAQSMQTCTLNELRFLSSMDLDSKNALTVVLAGDQRLLDRLMTDELLPLGTRIHTRLVLDRQGPGEMYTFLEHLLRKAGNPTLLSQELKKILSESCAGNFRMLAAITSQLLSEAMAREIEKPDEKLYMEMFTAAGRMISEKPN